MADTDNLANEIRQLFRKAQEAEAPRRLSIGEMLIEARGQCAHKDFYDWAKRNFKMTRRAVDQLMDDAYTSRRRPTQGTPNG